MTEEQKKLRKKQGGIIVVALLLLFLTAILAVEGVQVKFLAAWHSWFTEELPAPGEGKLPNTDEDIEQPIPEEIDEDIEQPIPEKTDEKQEPDQMQEEPADIPHDAETTPIIYVGQKLLLPFSGTKQTVSQVITQGVISSQQPQIALTFDAGWLFDQTNDILDVLDDYGIKSTFFLRALWAEAHPDLAREINRRGHRLENHSLTHGHLIKMTDDEVRKELQKSTSIIKEITGSQPRLFRPPYGEYHERLLQLVGEAGYPYTVTWTVDSHDWAAEIRGQQVTTDYLVARVLNNASPNGIILMHLGGYQTVAALPRIITGLQDQGYRLVTVNEMLPPTATEATSAYTVQPGDTLYAISRRYKITVQELIQLNNL
ncbi:MAG TPA: polysaccharide deacetylase family protein [Oscillospiraceae bacterium]|nr:polysaccharide deacetylase family protein [Oscillospiraceae bacterium]